MVSNKTRLITKKYLTIDLWTHFNPVLHFYTLLETEDQKFLCFQGIMHYGVEVGK